jgi:probable phosphoglycerate mutase
MNDPIRRLYVLRHGDVAYFDEQGHALDSWTVHLTKRGRDQIGAVAEQLASCGVDLLVTSNVPRALESADIVAGRLGLAPVGDDAWNELQPGDLSAVAEADLRRVIVDAYHLAAAPGARFLGGELFRNFAGRIDRALVGLIEDTRWTTALVITHDPIARYVLAKALGLGLAGLHFFEQDAGCLNIIDWVRREEGSPGPIIRLVNGTADNLVKLGRRDPALERFYDSYLASRASAHS